MQSNIGLTFEAINGQAGFLLTSPMGDVVSLVFEEAPKDYFIGSTNDAVIYMITDEIRLTAYNTNGDIIILLEKPTNMPHSFTIKLVNLSKVELSGNDHAILHLSGSKIYLDLMDSVVVNHSSENITITMSGTEAQCKFSAQATASIMTAKAVVIQSIDGSKLLIPASKRIPEFIISIYDDSAWKRPRPSRFGVPVISTVPGFIPDDSWGVTVPIADKDMMELGVGTESRTMYFRVISDQEIDASIRDNVKLEIDLPAGSDTVVETVSIPLTYDSTLAGSQDTNEVFSGSYVFHREDTVDYVDGFAYLSVRLPLRVQRNLPLLFQVSTSGAPFEDPDDTVPIDSVEPLSVDINAVQPIVANSIQGTTEAEGKNKKSGRKPKPKDEKTGDGN